MIYCHRFAICKIHLLGHLQGQHVIDAWGSWRAGRCIEVNLSATKMTDSRTGQHGRSSSSPRDAGAKVLGHFHTALRALKSYPLFRRFPRKRPDFAGSRLKPQCLQGSALYATGIFLARPVVTGNPAGKSDPAPG